VNKAYDNVGGSRANCRAAHPKPQQSPWPQAFLTPATQDRTSSAALRYDKLARNFLAATWMVGTLYWTSYESRP